MKKLFHFNFSIFRSGGALRHSPLCSLIIALVLVLSLTLYPVSPARANALQQIQPVYDTSITQLYEMVSQRMTPVQEDVFNLMLGTYAAGYGGFAQYQLSDPYANQDGVIAWLKSCGVELYNTILSFGGIGEDPITGIDLRPVIKSLVEVAYGVGVKAQSYTGDDPESDFISDVSSSTNYYLPYNLDINSSLNQMFGYVGGMYDWQFDVESFSSSVAYKTFPLPVLVASQYNARVALFTDPIVRGNSSSDTTYWQKLSCPSLFGVYNNIFINTTDHSVYLCDDSGVAPSGRFPALGVDVYSSDEISGSVNSSWEPDLTCRTYFYDPNNFDTYLSLVHYIYDLNVSLVYQLTLFYEDFVQHIYYGSSWDDKSELFYTTDLNIADTPIEYVSNPPADSDTLLDIKGLIQDLIDTNDLRAPVINNFYYPDETSVPEVALDRTTYDPTDYAGVVSVPDGIWDGLATDDHDGFIDYLWYMTKPLVQFTAGFIESVTFGPEGGFDETGPGIIVFGVISLGLAGGLVSKFLL